MVSAHYLPVNNLSTQLVHAFRERISDGSLPCVHVLLAGLLRINTCIIFTFTCANRFKWQLEVVNLGKARTSTCENSLLIILASSLWEQIVLTVGA